jgi:hypothetical protein
MQRKHLVRPQGRLWLPMVVVLVLGISVTGVAYAAEFGEGESYVLPAGQTVADDLYVSARTATIDGRVEGDLVAFGESIEVNGEVTGDVIAAGANVVINGTVGDDARLVGAGITVNGTIGDDLMAAGGGTLHGGFVFPFTGSRPVRQGVYLSADSNVGGDAYIAGGTGEIAGTVGGDLFAAMNEVNLTGVVEGNADLRGVTVSVADSANVGGSLTYEASGQGNVPADAAGQVTPVVPEPIPPEPLGNRVIRWVINLARALLGIIVLGALLLFLFPGFTTGAAAELRGKPWTVLAYGVLVVLLAFPLTIILVGLAWLFWRAFPGGVAFGLFMLGFWGVLWLISPAISGLWLGQALLRNTDSKLLQLSVGAAIILLLARAAMWIPFTGALASGLVLLVSFIFAAGAIVALRRRPSDATRVGSESYAATD